MTEDKNMQEAIKAIAAVLLVVTAVLLAVIILFGPIVGLWWMADLPFFPYDWAFTLPGAYRDGNLWGLGNVFLNPLVYAMVLPIVIGYLWRLIWHEVKGDPLKRIEKLKKDLRSTKEALKQTNAANQAEVATIRKDHDQVLRVLIEKAEASVPVSANSNFLDFIQAIKEARPLDPELRTMSKAEADHLLFVTDQHVEKVDKRIEKLESDTRVRIRQAKTEAKRIGEAARLEARDALKRAFARWNPAAQWNNGDMMLAFEDVIEDIFASKGASKETLPQLLKRIRWLLGEIVLTTSKPSDDWVIRLTRDRGGPLADLIEKKLVLEERPIRWVDPKGWTTSDPDKAANEKLNYEPDEFRKAWWVRIDEETEDSDDTTNGGDDNNESAAAAK